MPSQAIDRPWPRSRQLIVTATYREYVASELLQPLRRAGASRAKRGVCRAHGRYSSLFSLTKLDMAKKMATSRSQLDRVLDPSNVSVQLDTLIKAARALGKEIEIKIKRAAKKEAGLNAPGAGRLPLLPKCGHVLLIVRENRVNQPDPWRSVRKRCEGRRSASLIIMALLTRFPSYEPGARRAPLTVGRWSGGHAALTDSERRRSQCARVKKQPNQKNLFSQWVAAFIMNCYTTARIVTHVCRHYRREQS